MFKNLRASIVFAILFLVFLLSFDVISNCHSASSVIVMWDKSGSMYRVNKKERMNPSDLARMNDYVTDILATGKLEMDTTYQQVDMIQQNTLNHPLLTPGDAMTFVDFGLYPTVKHDGIIIQNADSIRQLLPSANNPAAIYTENDTYYRRAFVRSFEIAQSMNAGRRYLMTVSDETESIVTKDPEVEDRYNQLMKQCPLVFYMLVNRWVELRIYDLSPPPTRTPTQIPSPTPTLTPTHTPTPVPSHTPIPTETSSPSQTPSPTDTPFFTFTPAPTTTSTPTNTPLPVKEIQLLDSRGKPVSKITFEQKGKGKTAEMESMVGLTWKIPGSITAYPDQTACLFGKNDPVDVVFHADSSFSLKVSRSVFNSQPNRTKLEIKLPYTDGDGTRTVWSLSLPYQVKGGFLGILSGIVFILIILGAIGIGVFFLIAEKVADIQLLNMDGNESTRTVTLKRGDQYLVGNTGIRIDFDGNSLRVIDPSGNVKPVPFQQQYALHRTSGQTISLNAKLRRLIPGEKQ